MIKCPGTKMDRKVYDFGKVDDGPGPAGYYVKSTVGQRNRMPTIHNAPAFSVKQRLDVSDETESPGPVYNLGRLTCRGRAEMPKYSLGPKIDENWDDGNPGPAAYYPKTVRKPKIKILLPLNYVDPRADNPGPNVYRLPTTLSKKSTTLAKKINEEIEYKSPGPAVYQTVPLNRYKKKAPYYTLAKKFENPLLANELINTAPGPQAYNPTLRFKYKTMPKFSFGMRRPDKFPPLVVCGDGVKKKK